MTRALAPACDARGLERRQAMCLVVVALAVVVRSIGRSPQPTRPGTIDALATSSDACVTCHRKSSPGIVEQYGHRWLWLPTVGGTFAMVVATVLGMIERPTRTDLWTYVGAMILLLAIGASVPFCTCGSTSDRAGSWYPSVCSRGRRSWLRSSSATWVSWGSSRSSRSASTSDEARGALYEPAFNPRMHRGSGPNTAGSPAHPRPVLSGPGRGSGTRRSRCRCRAHRWSRCGTRSRARPCRTR